MVYGVVIVVAILQNGFLRLSKAKQSTQIHRAGKERTECPDSKSHAFSVVSDCPRDIGDLRRGMWLDDTDPAANQFLKPEPKSKLGSFGNHPNLWSTAYSTAVTSL